MKDIAYALLIIIVIVFLGLTPAKPSAVFQLKWEDIGIKMVEAGVIDKEKFEELYNQRGGLSETDIKLLTSDKNENIEINTENSGIMLNMLWAFGLGNKNEILQNGPMMDERYGNPGNFASTGGWTLSRGHAMSHYSMHSFVNLTKEQQVLVERAAKNIYRPCCGNSTHFPDCNHGMAMLGLLELMASQGASESDMYKTALEVNSLWFPQEYDNIQAYLTSKNLDWKNAEPKEILGVNYSSAEGYQKMLLQMQSPGQKNGTGCGA